MYVPYLHNEYYWPSTFYSHEDNILLENASSRLLFIRHITNDAIIHFDMNQCSFML